LVNARVVSLSLSPRDYDVAFLGAEKQKKRVSLSSLVGGSKTEVLSSLSFVAAELKSIFMIRRELTKYICMPSLSLSLLRAFVLRGGVLVVREKWVKIFAFFTRDG